MTPARFSIFLRQYPYVIATLLLHLLVFLYSRNAVVVEVYERQTPGSETIEMVFVPDVQVPAQEDAVVSNAEGEAISNRAFDLADSRETRTGRYDSRFSRSSVDDQVYRDLKAFEQAEFDRLAATRGENGGSQAGGESSVTALPDRVSRDPNTTANGQAQPTSSGAFKGRTTATYDLPGRKDERLPIPSYRCIGSGVIVVKIKVSRNGKVTSTRIDAQQSSYSEECMEKDALTFAARAKFSASSTAAEPQEGTITYTYVAQ